MIIESYGKKVRCICDSCGKEVIKYRSQLTNLEFQFCNRRCASDSKKKGCKIDQQVRTKALQNFGVEHHLKSPEVKIKREQTNVNRYGVKNQFLRPEIVGKIAMIAANRTFEERLEILAKQRNTTLTRYGVEHASQALEIHEKIKHSKSHHKRGHIQTPWGRFWYRSSWEKLFLDWCIVSNVKLVKPNIPIAYDYDEKCHVFFADFLVEHLKKKFLCEIKPDALANLPQSQAKFASARIWCSSRDITFVHLNKGALQGLEQILQ